MAAFPITQKVLTKVNTDERARDKGNRVCILKMKQRKTELQVSERGSDSVIDGREERCFFFLFFLECGCLH